MIKHTAVIASDDAIDFCNQVHAKITEFQKDKLTVDVQYSTTYLDNSSSIQYSVFIIARD